MRRIQFRPASDIKEPFPLLIEIAGPSWSGKTYSALRMAKGLAGEKPVFMIDTEEGRGAHYREKFAYQYDKMGPPFTYADHMEYIQEAINKGAGCVITDSLSHAHQGEGGYLEQHDAEVKRLMNASRQQNPDWNKFNMGGWIEPSKAKTRFIFGLGRLALTVPLIFCLRAKDKVKMIQRNNKTEIVELGWQPICSEGIDFEMTLRLMLPANSGGVPDLSLDSTKVNEEHAAIIRPDQQLSEQMGTALALWAKSKPEQTVDVARLKQVASDVASMGTERYRQHWASLSAAEQHALKSFHDGFKDTAAEVDAERAQAEEETEQQGLGV